MKQTPTGIFIFAIDKIRRNLLNAQAKIRQNISTGNILNDCPEIDIVNLISTIRLSQISDESQYFWLSFEFWDNKFLQLLLILRIFPWNFSQYVNNIELDFPSEILSVMFRLWYWYEYHCSPNQVLSSACYRTQPSPLHSKHYKICTVVDRYFM